MNYYSVIVGEVGSGKSSFINAVLKYGKSNLSICPSGHSYKSVTKQIDVKFIEKDNNKFFLIDTPGLNDGDGDEENKRVLRQEVSGSPESVSRINSILIVMKVTDYRLTGSYIDCIKEFINCFPVSNFWDHVLIIRTHTKSEAEINNIKGNFVNSVRNNKNVIKIMNEKNIKMPCQIKECYVNSVLENGQINGNMSGIIDDILDKIKKIDPLYEKVEYSGKMTEDIGRMKVTYQIMKYKDFNSGEWKECKKILYYEGSEETHVERVGSSYTKTCRKGRFQKYQKYVYIYNEKGDLKEKKPFGLEYEDLA